MSTNSKSTTLIVGLGNYGERYALNRHNIGFLIVDYLLNKMNIIEQNEKKKFKGILGVDKNIIFLKPLTYMNLSGESVSAVVNFYKIKLENVIVIQDDIDLKFGKIKISKGSSDAGHNGIKSINQYVANQYYRFRIGVGRPAEEEQGVDGKKFSLSVADYVLSNFSKVELDKIESIGQRIFNHFDEFTTLQSNNNSILSIFSN